MFRKHLWIMVLICGSNFAEAKLKNRIFVKPVEERFIEFQDSSQIRLGEELQILTEKFLKDSGNYRVFRNSFHKDLQVDFELEIKINSLFYSSGAGSNRVTYGFTPDILNPYNEGKESSKRNEFSSQYLGDSGECSHLDFFNGSVDPAGGGPTRSNFGADYEGFELSLSGYGFGYHFRKFESLLGLEFILKDQQGLELLRTSHDFLQKGEDLSFVLKEGGVFLEFERQRRKTFLRSLEETLPKVIQNFMVSIRDFKQRTKVIEKKDSTFLIALGSDDGMLLGRILYDEMGNEYRVSEVYKNLSLLKSKGSSVLQLGDYLFFEPKSAFEFFQSSIASYNEETREGTLSSRHEALQESKKCFGQRAAWWEKILDNFTEPLGYWRYKNVYDQSFDFIDERKLYGSKIALVASGVYPYQKELKQKLSKTGYDFISLDNRPSDDLGLGTAAAKYLAKNLDHDHAFQIVPYKVIGPRGEISSSALYLMFEELKRRPDIRLVVIPFVPVLHSEVLVQGIEDLVALGKSVYVSNKIPARGAIKSHRANRAYNTWGLAKVRLRLSLDSRGVMDRFIKDFRELK